MSRAQASWAALFARAPASDSPMNEMEPLFRRAWYSSSVAVQLAKLPATLNTKI